MEVDTFLQEYEEAKDKTYESHPEICFVALTDQDLVSKRSEDGRCQRLEVLKQDPDLFDFVSCIVDEREDGTEWHDRISKGRLDDVIDAAVLALTAKELDLGSRNGQSSYRSLPEDETPDDDPILGVPMEIVYPGTRE